MSVTQCEVLRGGQTLSLATRQAAKLAVAREAAPARDGRVKSVQRRVHRGDDLDPHTVSKQTITEVQQVAHLGVVAAIAATEQRLSIFKDQEIL